MFLLELLTDNRSVTTVVDMPAVVDTLVAADISCEGNATLHSVSPSYYTL